MGDNYYGTVDDLLDAAGRNRKRKRAPPGYHCDHIVELQLIVAAVNGMADPFGDGQMGQMIDFFQDKHNFQQLPPGDNQRKRDAVTRLIQDLDLDYDDMQWIKNIQSKWIQLRRQLSFIPAFVTSLDNILSVW